MKRVIAWCGGMLLTCGLALVAATQGTKNPFPEPTLDDPLSSSQEQVTAVVAGGCFWGIEEVFQHVRGVVSATSGYAGGSARDAKYDLVSMGTTGHAESVKVVYDPSKISYGTLLQIFFSVAHDPTQRGGQGPDMGPQYRSAVFYGNQRQQEIARGYIDQLRAARTFGKKEITTELAPLGAFYNAEPYHQDYAARNPTAEYIVIFDRPKVEALKKRFPDLYMK